MILIRRTINNSCRLSLGLFVLLVGVGSARAASLTDYRLRVSHAADTLERLEASYLEEDSLPRENFAGETIGHVLEQLPAHETVTLVGRNVPAENDRLP